MSELKECPFCGSDVRWHSRGNHLTGNGTIIIWCDSCSVEMTEFYLLPEHINKENKHESYANAKDLIFNTWNNRI